MDSQGEAGGEHLSTEVGSTSATAGEAEGPGTFQITLLHGATGCGPSNKHGTKREPATGGTGGGG